MFRFAPVLALALFTGCTAPTAVEYDASVDSTEDARTLDLAEELGLLAYLNSESVTESILDSYLDRRAARSLTHHRNGPDGVFGTGDDNLFDNVAEVDAQHYVGNSAIEAMIWQAGAYGFVPQGNDHVGRWDGVDFTLDQLSGTLAFANEASHDQLDYDMGLDRRAADSIIEAQPIASMDELAGLYFVGKTALSTLKDHVIANSGAGVHEDCDTTADCAEGLVCMGEIAYNSGIMCQDESTWDNFTYDEASEIPDNGSLVTHITAQGLASVPVDVVLTLDIDHPRPSDLYVTIEHIGYEGVVWDHELNPSEDNIIRAFPSDDMANGDYTVTIRDTVSGETGELRGWNLYIVSTWD